MKNKFKMQFIRLFQKKEKTTRWNWILRIGLILFAIAVFFTIAAIVLTMLANNEDLRIFGMELNDASVYSGIGGCLFAVVGIFFVFCGKNESRQDKPINY